MKIVMAGGTGLLGSALGGAMARAGHTVTVLARTPKAVGQVAWTPDGTTGAWAAVVDGADAVVNLAGAAAEGALGRLRVSLS